MSEDKTVSEQVTENEPANSPDESPENKEVNSPSRDTQSDTETEDSKISRRKAKQLEREAELKEMEKRMKQMESAFQYAQRKQEEDLRDQQLKQIGVETYDSDAYEAAKKELLDDGLPVEKAVKYALMEAATGGRTEKQEETKRSEGRKGSSLPPRSTVRATDEDAHPQMTREEYSKWSREIYRQHGREKGAELKKQYDEYQVKKGRELWK
jgi:hypothetical protein